MRKLLFLLGILLSTPALATDYYFSTSGVTTSLPCSQGSPCSSFNGTTLDDDNALSPGDHLKFKRGDTWTGSSAEVIISSNGTANNPIYVEAYGTGANPQLALAPITSTGWTNTSGNIYSHGGSTSTWMDVVTQDDNKALFYWNGSNAALPQGTYQRVYPGPVYVHLWGDGNPATHSVRIADFANSASADGARGLISIGKFTSGNTLGQFVRVRDISIIGSNGVGFSTSATYTMTAGLSIMGAGKDGWLSYCDLTSPLSPITGECGDHYRSYYDTVTYSAAGANGGGGSGQGVTYYSDFGWTIGLNSHYNAMAGVDWLNFGPSTNVTEAGCLRCTAYFNGIAQVDPSFDANFYVDGGTKMLLWGNVSYGGGIGIISPPGTSSNQRTAFANQSEHPSTDPMNNSYIGNNLCFGTHGDCLNTGSTTNNADVINWWNNTLVALNSTSYENFVLDPGGHVSTANSYHWKNNIIIADSSLTAFPYMPSEPIGTKLDYLDSDYNLYWRRSGYSNIYSVADETCQSSTPSSTCWDIARWRTNLGGTGTGDESHSAFSDPLITLDSNTVLDAHLGLGSPAIDTGTSTPVTLPAWIPATLVAEIGSCGVKGTTQADGTPDTCASLDMGYHYSYAGLTNTNVEPASLVASAAGNVTVSFTIPDLVSALLYNWKIQVVFPAGYTFNSGGTTDVTLGASISGTATVSISGQTVTITRTGDGNSEFPGDFSLVLSHIHNPSALGATGTYSISTLDSSDTVIATDPSVSGDTITSGGGGGGVFTTVQTATQATGSGATCTMTTSATVSGNLLVGALKGTQSKTVTSVTDNKGNVYVVSSAIDSSSTLRLYQFYGVQVTGGTTSVVVHMSGSGSVRCGVDEFSGNASTNATAFDTSSTGTGSGTSLSVSTLTPSASGELIVSALSNVNAGTWTAGTNYTIYSGTDPVSTRTEYRLSSAASETAPATTNTTGVWAESAMAFQSGSGGSSPPVVTANHFSYKGATFKGVTIK